MAAVVRALLPHQPVNPTHTLDVDKLFSQIFQDSIAPTLVDPNRVKQRIDQSRYITRLYFGDRENTCLLGAFSMDERTFKFEGTPDTVRIHFLHPGSNPSVQKALLLQATAKAIDMQAKVIIFIVSNKNMRLKTFLEDQGFSVRKQKKKETTMEHNKIEELKVALETLPAVQRAPVHIPIPGQSQRVVEHARPPEAALALPVPSFYRNMTLMKKYLHMIRDGRKPVEGRINSGAFSNVRIGSGFRFFYMQNKDDDVHCTVTDVKTFPTFRDMLKEFGWQQCVPDAQNLEHAVQIYDQIPGYKEKAQRHGVVGMRLRVDGHGPSGPAHRVSSAGTNSSYGERADKRKRDDGWSYAKGDSERDFKRGRRDGYTS